MSSKLNDKIREIWPLFPAAIFLISFFLLVLISLVTISLTKDDVFPTLEPAQEVFEDFFSLQEISDVRHPLCSLEPSTIKDSLLLGLREPTTADEELLYNKPLPLNELIDIFKQNDFREALITTMLFVLVGTPLQLLVGLFAALLIYNSYWGKSFLRSVFVIPFAFPGLVIATLLFILFDSQGGFANHLLQGEYWLFPKVIDHDVSWRGTKFLALTVSMIGKLWRDMPISMLIILSGLNSIEPELLDAAKTMGAGFRERLVRIILPLVFPAMTTVLLLRSVEMWKEFIFPYVLAGNYPLLATLIEDLYGFGSEPGEASVVALFLVLFTVLTLVAILQITGWIKKHIINAGANQ